MDDAQADETRADGAPGDNTRREAQAGGAQAGDGPDAAKLRRLRLSGFLRELVRAEGRMEAAELLGVAYRTLVRAEESGEITGRMNDALERLLGTGDDPEVARLRASIGTVEERMASLEAGLETLAEELRDGLDGIRAAAPGGPEDEAEAGIAGENAAARDAGDRADGAGVPRVAGLSPDPPFTERRLDPELVTGGAADDDPQVYGAAWPLVAEWRGLRADHPDEGGGLSWLETRERLLAVELAMLEEHGLTLPPETQPLRGFARRGQTRWRRRALDDTRRALARRRLLRWIWPPGPWRR